MKLIRQFNPIWSNASIQKQAPNTQRGFSLIELMIALTIGLALLMVITTVFTSSRQAFRVQEDHARIQESGRFALEIIGRSIKQAGYVNVPFTGSKVSFTGIAITGTNGAASAADTISLQYDGVAGDRECTFGTLVTAANVTAGSNIIQAHFNLDAANAQLQCAGTIAALPAAAGAPPTGSVLLENIEDLQILYGVDTTGDQSANQYVAAPADWTQVVTARICVLARSDKTNIVISTAGTYLDCNGAAVAVPADRRLRHAFTETFTLRNRVNILP